jgi:release factor glutamine methyltransferase
VRCASPAGRSRTLPEAPVSVAGLIEAAAERLRAGVRIPKPRREAHRLWAAASRLPAGMAYLHRDRDTDQAVARVFEDMVARRLNGEPMPYVIGETGFRHLTLAVDRRALIPRPESEGIIDHALERVRSGRAVDLGTGTGCLALALTQEGSFDLVVGVDRSADALALAAENCVRSGLRVELVRGDLAAPLAGSGFDLLVSNPPYLTEAEYEALDPSVRDWEPALALASGADGMSASTRILAEGGRLLRPGGWLVMELDSSRAPAGAAVAVEAGWDQVHLWNDLFGRARYLTARRGYA